MYVKQFDKEGNLLNPITKENPFINKGGTHKFKKERIKSKWVIVKHHLSFFRYFVSLQRIGNKTIEHKTLISDSSLIR